MKIHWGICSTGTIAVTMANALHAVPDAVCYAVSSRSKEKAEDFARKNNFQKSYGSYGEMLADSTVDVVYIASPMACHFQDAMQALQAGKHVLCEKAVTMCTMEWEQLVAEAQKQKRFLMEAMWMKCRPTFLQALHWVKAGRIGTVKMVQAEFCNVVPYDANSRLFRPDLGGGALLDLGVYPLTLIEAFLDGDAVQIQSTAYIGKSDVDFDMAAIVTYPNGVGIMSATFDIAGKNAATIIGTKGRIELPPWFLSTCEALLYDEDNQLQEHALIPNRCNGYEYEVEEVHRCLREGLLESTLVPHHGTTAVMRQMDTCRSQWAQANQ